MKRTKTIDCMVPFTEAELRALTTEVTRLFWQRAHLEEEKKETAKAFADQIADLSMEISEHMEELRLGGRLQPVVCVEEFNTPEPGKKTVTRTDTGAVIAEKEMSLDEINDMFVQHGNDEIPEGTEGTEGTEVSFLSDLSDTSDTSDGLAVSAFLPFFRILSERVFSVAVVADRSLDFASATTASCSATSSAVSDLR